MIEMRIATLELELVLMGQSCLHLPDSDAPLEAWLKFGELEMLKLLLVLGVRNTL